MRPSSIVHFESAQIPKKDPLDTIDCLDCDYSKPAGFKRVGIHHVTVAPGTRTSLPHAESLEEEFVLVLEGTPDLWVDGWIHPLKPLDGAGFPSGTGVCHTVINNTDRPVHLLVVGERTKPDNRWIFPLHENLRSDIGEKNWWTDWPKRELGPHDGSPRKVLPSEIAKERPAFIKNAMELKAHHGFHYSGCEETFGVCRRFTHEIGLVKLGISFETLPAGVRSCYPHAHTHEEEFCYIVSGQPNVWLNGSVHEMNVGEAVTFTPNTNESHCLINDTDADATYICVGEAVDFPDEKIIYPRNAFRNEQCRKGNWLWISPPEVAQGSHDGMPRAPKQKSVLTFTLASEADSAEILAIFEKSPTYFARVDGVAPTMTSVTTALTDGPKKTVEGYRKEFMIVRLEGKPVGVIDFHANHPEEGVAYIGLLLFAEDQFGRGLGRRAFDLLIDYAKKTFKTKKFKLGVSDDNDVSEFWKKLGFTPSGHTFQWKGESKTTHVVEYHREI